MAKNAGKRALLGNDGMYAYEWSIKWGQDGTPSGDFSLTNGYDSCITFNTWGERETSDLKRMTELSKAIGEFTVAYTKALKGGGK